MKKLNKILFSSIALPTAALSLMPLVSCGNKALNVQLEHDANIGGLVTSGEVFVNKSFKIIATLNAGWRQIDTDPEHTYIEVDGKRLEEGSTKDYEFQGKDTIVIHENVIKTTNVKVYVSAKATYLSNTYEWANTEQFKLRDNKSLLILPNQKVYPSNLKITITKGDGSTYEPECGWQEGQYSIKINDTEYTDQFKNGWSFDETIFTGTKIKPIYFTYNCIEEGWDHINSAPAWLGKTPTTLTLTGGGMHCNESEYLNYAAGNNEFPDATFEIIDSETTAKDAKIEKDKYGDVMLTAGTTAGVVKVKATSIFDQTLIAEATFTITA